MLRLMRDSYERGLYEGEEYQSLTTIEEYVQ